MTNQRDEEMVMSRLATFERAPDEIVDLIFSGLKNSGFEVSSSFNLQSARSELADPKACSCPHHGTSECNCQYVVMNVGQSNFPATSLVIHGHDLETTVTFSEELDADRYHRLKNQILVLITEKTSSSSNVHTRG
jgi:hypothetical protein